MRHTSASLSLPYAVRGARFACLAIYAMTLAGAAHAESPTSGWPLFRGDSQATGVAPGTLPDRLEVLWKFPAADGGFEATAVIDAGRVYVGSLDGYFYALDLATGNLIWKYKTELGFSAAAAVRDGRVIVGDSDGKVYAFNAAAGGKPLWTFDAGAEIDAGPNFHRDRVLIGSQDATLYCLDAKSGKQVWKFTIGDQIRCAPTIVEDRAFLAGCDSKLHVVDLNTGKGIAAVPIDAPTGSTPAVHGDHVFFGTEGGTFFCVNWRTAKVDWTYKSEGSMPLRSSAAVTDDLVVFGGRNKQVVALDPKDGSRRWSFTARSRIDGSPVLVGRRIMVGSADGRLYTLGRKTGHQMAEYEAGGQFLASPAVADGRLVIGNQRGALYCFGTKRPDQAKRPPETK